MSYGPGGYGLVTDRLPPEGDTVSEAVNKLDAQLRALYDTLNAEAARVEAKFKGEWNENTRYECNDVVTHNGATYVCTNTAGSPAGTVPTNTNYWGQAAAAAAALKFATAEETKAGSASDKAVTPKSLKATLDDIKGLVNALEKRATTLEKQASAGAGAAQTAKNADKLDGQDGSYYRCASGCSWTCMSACKSGCGNSCTGNCHSTCQDVCTGCTGTCKSGCTKDCANNCEQTCKGRCMLGCTSCSGPN